MMVIDACLTDADDFRMPGKRGEISEKIHRTIVENIARMQSYHGKDILAFLRDGDGLEATLAIDPDGDDTLHAGLAGTLDDGVEVPVELGKIEVRVGVGEHVATSEPRRRPK